MGSYFRLPDPHKLPLLSFVPAGALCLMSSPAPFWRPLGSGVWLQARVCVFKCAAPCRVLSPAAGAGGSCPEQNLGVAHLLPIAVPPASLWAAGPGTARSRVGEGRASAIYCVVPDTCGEHAGMLHCVQKLKWHSLCPVVDSVNHSSLVEVRGRGGGRGLPGGIPCQ